MVDKTQDNDEYEFVDYDTISPDPMGQDDEVIGKREVRTDATQRKSNVIKNVLVVIALIAVALVVYKFVSSFTKKTTSTDTTISPITSSTNQPAMTTPTNSDNGDANKVAATSTMTTLPVTSDNNIQQTDSTLTQPTPSSSATMEQTPTSVDNASIPSAALTQLDEKVSALDINQQNIRSDISTLTSQLTVINTNISNLSVKMDSLNQIFTTLSATIEKQINQLAAVTAVKKAPKIKRVVRRVVVPRKVYYIQAVIPGRAWLIATNGSTLTVREGTSIPGYGIVKLIDPNQGRILTSNLWQPMVLL
jgi:intracellular multiplication protein IcmG